ncbi:hypothetical protein L1987_87000 [Smallanthus sonchifolius]|uniref:Uncharacterized protein n=1 Tax=Smallanthus sonchifolius TaxID=185202 RepID=A0ACB8Y2F3_9ASTR|nr:hypothetical protein L1987_87000 [Smallanthus sonchifolius]
MIPSGCQNPPLKQPPHPTLEEPTVFPSLDIPKFVVSPQPGEEHTASLPISVTEGAGKPTYVTNGVQSRASPYDRTSSGGATRRKGSRMSRREKPQRTSLDPVKEAKTSAIAPDEEGFTIVNRKGKNKAIKLLRKKKQVVVRANPNGLNSNTSRATKSGDSCKNVAGPSYSNVGGSGFNFARAVQGAKAKPGKPPNQHPTSSPPPSGPGLGLLTSTALPTARPWRLIPPPVWSNNRFAALNAVSEFDPCDQNSGTGTTFSELDILVSIKRTSLVVSPSDLYPPDPINEDGTPFARLLSDDQVQTAGKCDSVREKLICQINREHVEGARLLPSSILSSPSPGGLHAANGGKTYGISESQRKAIADRISVSSSICIEETNNWCPGEWDYFNDLCISLGLDPDYCIEDVESDTENGTAQFFSGLLKAGCPKPNRTNFAELDLHASIKRTSLVEASSDLYPHKPMNEDGPSSAQDRTVVNDQAAKKCVPETEKVVCHLNREHIEGARLLPASILSSPSPGGTHTNGGGRTYGLSESQRKAIADRLSVSNSICSEETVNWCPGEWDYFNDLCISLGLDPDYCIEDVDSDTENGTAQFLSELLNSGCPRTNRKQ